VYFWEDLDAGMEDVFRVLRLGGRQVFAAAGEAILNRNKGANQVFRNTTHAKYVLAMKKASFTNVRSYKPPQGGDIGSVGSDDVPPSNDSESPIGERGGQRQRRPSSPTAAGTADTSSEGPGAVTARAGHAKRSMGEFFIFIGDKPAE